MITCNNNCCEHNQNNICKLDNISIVDCSCVSRRKMQPDDNYGELMRASDPIGFKRGGKWVRN